MYSKIKNFATCLSCQNTNLIPLFFDTDKIQSMFNSTNKLKCIFDHDSIKKNGKNLT